jgi:PAN domain-containing protein
VEALNTPWISPEERRRIEEVKARQQAEEEGRRREIEAKRRAEEEHRRQAEAEARRVAEEERRRQKAEAKQRADEEERRKRAEAKLRAEQGQAAAIEPHKVWDWLQNQPSGRVTAGVAALAVLLLIGVGGYAYVQHTAVLGTRQAVEHERQLRNAAEAEVKRINEETEQRRIAAFRADQDRQAAAEAEQKRKADEAEQQRLAAAKAEQERQARAAAEAKRKGDEAESQRLADRKAEQERQAKAAAEAEAKRKEQAEQQRLAAAKAEQERLAKVEQERQASTRFSIIKGLAVKGDEYKFVNTTTIERCSIECAGDTRCKMFAYWENQGISTNSLCYLFDKDFGVYSNPQAQVGYDRSKPFPQSEAKAEESEQQRIANFDSRSLCRVALDVQKSGWDQSTFYAPHVTEASRRGLTVDSCRQLLGMVTLRPGEQSSAQQRGLFTMRTGMEAYGNPTHSFLAESFEQCQNNCSQRSTCNTFTWSSSTRVCYLFERAELRKSGFFDSGLRN